MGVSRCDKLSPPAQEGVRLSCGQDLSGPERAERHPDKPRSQELNMNSCSDVPAAVWQKLGGQGDAFQKFRKASFTMRLGEQTALRLSPCCVLFSARCFEKRAEGVEGLLLALSRCQQLQDVGA